MSKDKPALLQNEFEVFATALLEVLISHGVITDEMLKQAIARAEDIHQHNDSTFATAFHQAAPLGTIGRR